METAIALLRTAISAGTPLLLATIGEIFAERSGVLNLGVEGMMIMGAVSGFVVTMFTGSPLLGIAAALMAGGLLALLHAFISISLRGNQVVSGLALTMIGLGLSALIGRGFVGIPLKAKLSSLSIPLLSDIPVIGEILFKQDPIVYFSYALTIASWITLYKTKLGVAIRAVGENPGAADAMGVNVYLMRYACVIFGGMLAGLAGAYLSIVYIPAWVEGMTAGRGWIAVALVIFALWDPLRAMLGAYLFGGLEAAQYTLQAIGINPCILGMFPYLATIAVLTLSASETMRKKIGAPSALCKPYIREERTI
ncbi:MAG: ABC transporter permease [Candidatus Methanomethylicota archaeon]|uniref:ABC transporter permease n=1 Tax=Thermoproteota archaeon TaxID=2056631 RepID=A0A497F2C3_9CREN|nr:MAG: ABC transporter permease [Candidatus Verstraetearchaeota archaeon]RLE53108.1 MAG: ABC transporter permease [Candidatus Verstraetearchaeota archaeon]